uniref:Zinc knuckle CX2CX4HX4C domain-containing protein n=1 Tax=Cannabis sativa TaxID=3483 RepID=A0A803PAT1_CANSA
MNSLSSSTVPPLMLTPDENMVYTMTEIQDDTSPDISLLLKLCTVKHFNRASLIKTLAPIWTSQCRFPVTISEHSDGLFLVTFLCEGDKRRILDGQPWHFAQSLTIFAAPDTSFPITPDQMHYVPFWMQVYGIPFRCKSYDLAKLIATGVGDLIQVDNTTLKDGTGPYLRARYLLDVNKPIRRGINICFIKMGREFTKWLDFKYERLPNFCFYCGKLDHTKKYCHAYLQKCDESIVPPHCPYDRLLCGKEKLSEKPLPFEYPHAPAITIADLDITDFPHEGQPSNSFLAHSVGFTSLLNSQMASLSNLSAHGRSSSVMIPTPMNPNLYVSQPVVTDSTIVSDTPASVTPDMIHAAHSLAAAMPSLGLGHAEGVSQAAVEEALQPDLQVKGKGLACASGVKRPCFQPFQAQVGGSLRSMLKRARAGESESGGVSSIETFEHRITRPEK